MADMRQVGRPQGVTATDVARASQAPLVRFRKWLGGSYTPYLYVAPFFIIFFAFFAYPVAYSFYVSLHHWAGVGAMRYVGLGNYSFVLSDNYWWNALAVTGILWLLVMPLGTAISLLVAVVFNRPRFFGRNVALVMYLLPAVISIVAASVVFRILYDPTAGPINVVLHALHLPTIPWLTSPFWSRAAVALIRLWESVGLGALFFSAALQNISPELYEAAAVDGCGPVRQFWVITLPLVTPTVLFLTVVGTLAVFGLFAEAQLITNGGPDYATTTLGLYLFNMVQGLDFGTASAVSFLMTILMMIVSIILFTAARRWTHA
jgi:ABC-type sugar transport system permease subunit